jgi:hypothetical protein
MQAPIYDVIKQPKLFWPKISNIYISPCTLRGIVISILALFKHVEILKVKKAKAYEQWRTYYDSIFVPVKESDDIEVNLVEIGEVAMKKLTHVSKIDSMRKLLLLFIAHAKQYDLGRVAIVEYPNHKSPIADYIFLNGESKSYLVLKKKRIWLDKLLYTELKESIRLHPRGYLIVDEGGQPYVKQNSFVVFVSRTFAKVLGKPIGVAALRKVLR